VRRDMLAMHSGLASSWRSVSTLTRSSCPKWTPTLPISGASTGTSAMTLCGSRDPRTQVFPGPRRRRRRAAGKSASVKPDSTWITDWRSGEASCRRREVSRELLRIFIAFWDAEGLSKKAKTTRYRYSAALHWLRGYLVVQATDDDRTHKTPRELLRESVGLDDGSLIHHDNEPWQRELDMVCRRLHRYLGQNG
jgi:hypothetical protein